jgi:arylsulfatase A-like enzyme
VNASSEMAPRLLWDFNQPQTDWKLLRGRMGFRPGELALKGEGSTPVIVSPDKTTIDWSRYESIRIRMIHEGGNEIKLKIGPRELKQKLGPRMQYQVYRFDLNITEPIRYNVPLAVMPTDDLNAIASIDSIEIIPRKIIFAQAAGRQVISKREEYRNALYGHSPSSISYDVTVPRQARLHFGIGVSAKEKPVTFRILAGSSETELFSKKLVDPGVWEDADVDLGSYAGKNTKLVFRTDTDTPGAIGFWANPLLTTKAPRSRPNVLVYMIDTLRADHSSLYGYSRDTTPFLKKLGSQGVVFDDCQVQATWTKPSTASLLTSLYSFTHGMIHDYDTIPTGATTFAEQLRAAGYVTASVIANPFAGQISGLQRGFDYLAEWAMVQRYRKDAEDRGTDSAALNKILFPWLEQHRDEPFFLYAHATDPHAPYRPPAGFEEKFANPADTPEFNRTYKRFAGRSQYGGGAVVSRASCSRSGINPERFIHQAIDRYDGEILHNDWSLEQLVNKLKQLGILDNTLIIVVSDHGEEFWEHGWTAHGHSLYQELTHGVLVMWNPKLIPTPRRVADPVQLIDVMPTVLDLLDIKIPDIVEGQSLSRLARGLPFHRKGLVMTSRFVPPHASANALIAENKTDTFALLEARWKLIYRDKAKQARMNRVELYDRSADRGDLTNVAAEHSQEVDQRMAEITKWIDAQTRLRNFLGRGGKSTPDQQTIDQLRSLGYLGGKQ